jgi:hypothetical protein
MNQPILDLWISKPEPCVWEVFQFDIRIVAAYWILILQNDIPIYHEALL